jgi:hypothetical protein
MGPPVVFAVALLSLGVTACGGASKTTVSASHASSTTALSDTPPATAAATTTPAKPSIKNDLDKDSDNNNDDYAYGYPASAADRSTVTALVRGYYAAAAADDGTTGCSLIYSLFAEEIPEVYGEPPGPPSLRGTTCAAVVSKLFERHHQEMIVDHATLKVIAVRVKGRRALVMLSFEHRPMREIMVRLERRTWKIGELLDNALG